MKQLKLVGAKTYFCEGIKGGYVTLGQIAEIENDEVADALLEESRLDDRNNRHKIFVRYTPAMAKADALDDGDEGDDGGAGDDDTTDESSTFVQEIPATVKKPRTRAAARSSE